MPSTEAQQPQPQTDLPTLPPPGEATAADSGLANSIPKAGQGPEDKKKEQSTLTFKKVFRSYLVPLIVLSVFGGMLIFLIIPKIGDILGQLDQTTSDYDQARELDKQIIALGNLQTSSQEFQANLDVINQIAPSGATEVVNFQKKILDLAKADSLTVQQSSLEESIKKSEDQTSVANLGIIEIPSTFSLRGQFTNLQGFVQSIRGLSDFVIIGEMALRANLDPNAVISAGAGASGTDDWTLIITLIKYQFLTPNAQNQLAQVFQRIPPESTVNQDVVDFANNKFSTAQTTDQTTTDTSGQTPVVPQSTTP